MTSAESARGTVSRILHERFAARSAAASQYGPEFAGLWRLIAEQSVGGKLLRPLLLLEMHAALGGSPGPATAELAAGTELLHLAFLMHDDVIDGDTRRRGRPNLVGRLRTEHAAAGGDADRWAQAGAILAGDLLLTEALLTFARADVSGPARRRLLDLFDSATTETVAGELADVAFSAGTSAADMDRVLVMTTQKTAAYSLEFPMLVAATTTGAGEHAEAALSAAGRSLGLAFQLQDDLLTAFGDPALHGKDPASDFREGKMTPVIAFARTTTAWRRIEPLFGRADLSSAEADAIRAHLADCGAADHVAALAAHAFADARRIAAAGVADGTLPPPAAEVISAYADRLDGRSA